MDFFNSLPVPEFQEWVFSIPFPFPNPPKSFPLTPGLCWANIDNDNDKLALCCANMEKIIINQVCVRQILIMIHLGSVGQVWIMIMID